MKTRLLPSVGVISLSRLKDIAILLNFALQHQKLSFQYFSWKLHNHNYWPYYETTEKQSRYCSHYIPLFNGDLQDFFFLGGGGGGGGGLQDINALKNRTFEGQ